MKEYRIINYSIEYQQKLKDFLKEHNPSFSDVYVDFLVDNAWNDKHEDPAILVVDENDNIVGEHLFFYTKAIINGVEQDIRWSHDTYLEESARRYIGLDFVLEINSRENCFGIGLSDINNKVTKKFKGVYWADFHCYLLFNRYIFMAAIKRLLGIRPDHDFCQPKELTVCGNVFKSAENVREFSIPDNGYWGKGCYDIDFIRDELYINRRFFNNPVYQYYVYRLVTNKDNDEAYFAVRIISYRGVKTLCVSDYRINPQREWQMRLIIKAASMLARKNKCGVTYLSSSDAITEQAIKKSLWVKKNKGTFVLPKYPMEKDVYAINATLADPDGEYHL